MFAIGISYRSKVLDCTPELFMQMTDAPITGSACAEIADYWEAMKRGDMTREEFENKKKELKMMLPIIAPHASFPSGRRKNEEAVPSGLSMYDIDHINDPRGYYAEHIEGRTDELGIVLAHVTPSLEGLRLVFRMPQGMSLEEAQRWMSHQLGDSAYDECTKDLARCSFLVPRDYFLFIDKEGLFSSVPSSEFRVPSAEFRVPSAECRVPSAERQVTKPVEAEDTEEENFYFVIRDFQGISYNDIIEEYWSRTGGVPGPGERNVRLHKLASNLRSICDNNEELLMDVMPRLGLSDDELASIVHSACKEQPRGFSGIMQSIVKDLKRRQEGIEDEDVQNAPTFTINPKSLPIGLRESLIGIPRDMYMPTLCAVMPLAATYADQVQVEYCDGNEQPLALMSIIYGAQASGKSVCTQVVKVWNQQLVDADNEARKEEEAWRERKRIRKANEKIPEDPRLLIRVVPFTVSCTTLLRRLKNARGHTLYSYGEELDTLRKTNGAGSWSSKYDIYRQSFDQSEWGQDYNSDQAESGIVKVCYNWTALGTLGALRQFFQTSNVENGLSSRMLLSQMPDASFRKMPHYGHRTQEDDERINQAVTKLRSASGFIDTPRLRKAIGRWVEEKRQLAEMNIDHVMDTYRRRAAVIGFRCGVVHHLLMRGKDGKEKTSSVKFAEMMAEYALQQQIYVFGDMLQKQLDSNYAVYPRCGGNTSVFDQLPTVFSMAELRELKGHTASETALRNIVYRWTKEKWIEKEDAHHWRKVSSLR